MGEEAVRLERWTSPGGKRRLLVHLDAHTAARYARAARIAVPRPVSRGQSFGSARRPDRPASFPGERRAWRLALGAALRDGDRVETGDVAACFSSIGERAIRAAARSAGGDPEPLLRSLRAFAAVGVPGLPLGPAASSYVADAVLAVADTEASRAGVRPLRWVDDVAFVGGAASVERSARAWRDALGHLGLAPHEGKRRVHTADGEWPIAGSGCSGDAEVRGIIRV
jgi:hypothetical protein